MDQWSAELLALLHDLKEVEIETMADDDGTTHRAIIWVVVDEGEVFIRSWKAERGRWYREIRERPEAVLHAAGRSVAVRVEPAVDPDTVRRVSDALEAKYRRGAPGSTAEMLLPDKLPTTLRLVPPG